MKKILALSILLLSLSSLANGFEDCDEENNLSKIAKGITYPNCNIPENIQSFKNRMPTLLCDSCKKEFELIHGKKIAENPKHLQEEFFQSVLNEYKKNVTNNLLTALKTKTLYPNGAKYPKAIAACKLKISDDAVKSCQSDTAKKLLTDSKFFKNLQTELQNETARYLSNERGFDPKPTLLKRAPQTCHIPESDILLFSASAIEDSLSPEMINYLKTIDPKKHSSVGELFSSDDFLENIGDFSELKVAMSNHPYFSSHMSSTENFLNFVTRIPAPSHSKDLKSVLYSKENGTSFDAALARNCESSFNALKESICSSEFEQGKIFNDPARNFSKLEISKERPSEESLSSTEKLVDTNIKLLEICENKEVAGSKNLTAANDKIGAFIQEDQKPLSFEDYTGSKYNSEIGSLSRALCEMTPEKCIAGTMTCSIYKKYKEFNDPKSKISRPVNFANTDANELIRAMLGVPDDKMDPKTKQILIMNGIFPKDDGKLAAQPGIPESQQEFFAKIPSPKINQVSSKSASSTVASSNAARIQQPSDNYSNNALSNSTPSAPTGNMDDISDLVRGSTEDIKDIQDEIKRRLGNLPQNKPASVEDAKKIARDTFKAKGRKITPYQEQALADRMLQPEVPNSVSTNTATNTNPNSPAVSNTETQAEKWRNGQKDAALMGMAGAQQVLANGASMGRGPASVEAKPKDLTKVALNIAEDPKVKLSDIFANKIDQNDPDTQLLKVLLKNKNNFLLQVKGMNFKIMFDDKNNFNVLLESGDRGEAERMRPQLEIFLKRLKS